MIEFLQVFLPIMIYFLLIILLIIGIVLGIRIIKTMTKVEKVVDDVSEKIQSLNGLFHAVDNITDKFASITDFIVDKIAGLWSNIFRRKKVKKEDDYE